LSYELARTLTKTLRKIFNLKGFIMAFRVNTNALSLSAQQVGSANNRAIENSLEKLSSGLRINKAADDASGLQIADSLRSQANSLGQAIKNANDGVGIIQTADKAMDEQTKILDTIKTKATQAAQDGQTEDSRKAIQQDITKLMDEMDNIASTTSFNGQSLLSGQYTDKKFQIGAYSNESVSVNIGATSSDKVGHTRFETGQQLTASAEVSLNFKNVDGLHDVQLESVVISTSAGTGLGVLAETINKNSDKLGLKASFNVQTTADDVVRSGSIEGLSINGISIGNIEDIKANDKDGTLVNAINALTDKHGVTASIDERGRLNLTSVDGRGIRVSAAAAGSASDSSSLTGTLSAVSGLTGSTASQNVTENYGRLTLTKLGASDIVISGTNADLAGFAGNESAATINLRDIKGGFTVDQASAMGAFSNDQVSTLSAAKSGEFGNTGISGVGLGAGVTTLQGAMATMSIAEAAMKDLNGIRSNLGSTQNQLITTINNISVTQVNVKAAESQIRDVDFAAESANFQKNNILAQAGSYAMSQANQQQQGVMRLLQ
jgi:flagellin